MRAVIVATGECPDMNPLNERHPTPLLPLVDRPFLQHVVEMLIDQGVTDFDFILCHLPEEIERTFEDGTRWGSRFRYHLVHDARHPYGMIGQCIAQQESDESVVLVHGDRLPQLDKMQLRQLRQSAQIKQFVTPSEDQQEPIAFCWRDAESKSPEPTIHWTGWAYLPGQACASLPEESDEQAVEAHVLHLAEQKGRLIEVPKPLSVQSFSELLSAHRQVLEKQHVELMLTGREIEPGVWLSRNVSLHPTARLVPPVYIGESCRIEAGVQVGPHAVIERDCVLDTRCLVSEALVFAGSYVGEALEVTDAIVDKNCLVDMHFGTTVTVSDDFLLGSLPDKLLRPGISKLVARAAAVVLLACSWPLILLTGLYLKLTRPGPALFYQNVVRLPAASNALVWETFRLWSFCPPSAAPSGTTGMGAGGIQDFFFRFLPALVNVAKGQLRFVGVEPRSEEEIQGLSPDWRALYLSTKAGIVTEAYVSFGHNQTADERYSAEVFYAVSAGIRHDTRLLLGYIKRLFSTWMSRPQAWPIAVPE